MTHEGGPKTNQNLFIKNCVFILTCLNFGPLQSTLHLRQYTYGDMFPTAQKSFWAHQFWCLLVLLPFFVFHISKMFSFEAFFNSEKEKKIVQGKMESIGRVGHRGHHAIFGQKLLNMQWCVGRCTCKSPIIKWVNVLKGSSKKFTGAECSLSQQHQLAHWYRWIPRTLIYLAGEACTTRCSSSRR